VLVGAEPLVATGLRAPEYIGGTATPRRSVLPKPVAFLQAVCPPVYVRLGVRLACYTDPGRWRVLHAARMLVLHAASVARCTRSKRMCCTRRECLCCTRRECLC
jgi:hypothetical protein